MNVSTCILIIKVNLMSLRFITGMGLINSCYCLVKENP